MILLEGQGTFNANNWYKPRQLLILLSIGIVALVAFLILTAAPGERISIIQAEFGDSNLQSGGSTSLTLRIKNTSSEVDAYNISVVITPSDTAAVQVDNAEVTIDTLGAGEERVIEFSISVAQESLPGKYKLKVSTSAGELFEGENLDLYLEVGST